MKFFYAVIVYIISSCSFFWLFLLIAPTPRLTPITELTVNTSDQGPIVNAFFDGLNYIKYENKGELYKFSDNLEDRRQSSIIVYLTITFILILLSIIIFHNRSHILFPLIASLISTLVIAITLWIFTNTISKNIYLDIQEIIDQYRGLETIRFLGFFLFIEIFILIFGYWYRIPD